jgi:hypothetical protein
MFCFFLSTVPPEEITYGITNRGVKIMDKTTDWELLTRFWYTKRFDSSLLVFEMTTLPGRLEVVVFDKDKEEITKILSEYVVEEEAPPSGLDKAANYLSEKLPLKK